MGKMINLISARAEERTLRKLIHTIRGTKIIFDRDLASLYDIETRVLEQAVNRNKKRFPEDFMFVLTKEEVRVMVSQNVIPSRKYLGGALPYAFTEQGVANLSSILNSSKAIEGTSFVYTMIKTKLIDGWKER